MSDQPMLINFFFDNWIGIFISASIVCATIDCLIALSNKED